MTTPIPDLVSPWHPMSNPVDQKVTGKLMEELGECVSAVARCQIQGIYESQPITGKLNKLWLEEEIADVEAGIEIAKQHFQLDRVAIDARKARKIDLLLQWHRNA